MSSTGKEKVKNLSVLVLAASLTVFQTGCGNSQSSGSGLHSTELAQWVGMNVRVELRRDAVGITPVEFPKAGGGTNGTPLSITGKLVKIHSISLVVENGQRQIWIPREVILFVELVQ